MPREHYDSLLDVPQEIGDASLPGDDAAGQRVRHVTGSSDMNIVVNSGAAAGQDEPHYHVHIIPRRENDGFDIQLPFAGSSMPDRTRARRNGGSNDLCDARPDEDGRTGYG